MNNGHTREHLSSSSTSMYQSSNDDCVSVTSSYSELSDSTSSTFSAIPADIASSPEKFPVQPVLSFPSVTLGNKRQCFDSEWYKHYPWLEYSQDKDAGYCYL